MQRSKMNNFNRVEEKVKDLIAECHEHGISYLVSVMDKDGGDTINAIEGYGDAAMVMLAIFIQKIVEVSNLSVDDVIDHIKMMTEAAIEVNAEKKVNENRAD